jgi:flagellar basal-body rod modification protein FlgD
MSGTVQSSATAAAVTSSTSSANASGAALSSLTSNFQDFLGLLMTQLQNQDPTSPMDANQFTSELVQFASVEQQISSNSNLSQLITLTQSGQDMQAASIVGHQVQVASPTMPLQNGTGAIQFSSPSSQPLTVTISDANGNTVATQSLTATQGTNNWTWNGANSNGTTEPDGAYTVAVNTASGTATSVPFTVLGTVTGVNTSGSTMQLDLGAVTVPISSLQSIVN